MPVTRPLRTRAALGVPALFATLVAVVACGGGGDAGRAVRPEPPAASSWDRIQANILTPSCATGGCHTDGAPFAVSSGLVLDKAVAYQNLVGVSARNDAARQDGMLRVKPGDPSGSYLYWKLTYAPAPAGRDYGSPMPLSGLPLYNGQIEYIRRWIAAGAPRTGDVVDTALLADRTRLDPGAFTPLPPPSRGVQLRLTPFPVQPNFERELFVYQRAGNTSDIYVNRIETKMRFNSHHFLLYTFRSNTPSSAVPAYDVVRDIRNPDGSMNVANMLPMAYHVFFGGAMAPASDYRFPDGVALRVPAGAALDLNAHYVNKSAQPITGEAYANLHTIDRSQVQREARTIDMNNQDIVLPPRQRTTVSKTFLVAEPTTIFLLTSHMHARGERFVIRLKGGARDGEVVYESTDWEHPLMKSFPQPIVLEAGQGLRSEITYNNTSDKTVRFGLASDDEMGIIFGYYY